MAIFLVIGMLALVCLLLLLVLFQLRKVSNVASKEIDLAPFLNDIALITTLQAIQENASGTAGSQ
jgi:hypothetical protein